MLQVAIIREEKEKILAGLKKRRFKNAEELKEKADATSTRRFTGRI